MSGRPLTPVQLAERVVMVLKPLDDLDPPQQLDVLKEAVAQAERLAEKKP